MGVSAQGGVCLGGVSAWGGGLSARENSYPSATTVADGNKVYFHYFLRIVCSKNLSIVNLD